MRSFDPAAGISWWLRPGGHGIVEEDIDAFIRFLEVRGAPASAALEGELQGTGTSR
jgi:hypothetical protein